MVASVLGLMFISLIAAAAGSSEQETVTVAEVRTQTEQEVVTVTQTRTVRAPAARTPAAPAPTPQPPAAAARTFEGNGSRNIGNLTLAEDATLRWTNNGDLIQIFVDEPFNVLLNSQGPSGETFVAAGTYNGITVNAIGDWTLSFE
ncbi:hypothetical protein [Miltoncostaea oceani]|uniref:hypothetical protein n=1 Tax=Miltoncostaea oceani TaxID=2843216 RepID=UPI001C3E4FDB|nr:hypothetical protein [Miltoncostaea oceani]